VFFQEMP